MARRKKGRPVHGWLIFDKPVGMTSPQAVGLVRRLFDAQKAGHAGTLDPLATGILPIALGEATKTVPYAVDGVKHYRFTVRWGAETDTDDAEGDVTITSDARPRAWRSRRCWPSSRARSCRCRRVLGHQGGRQSRLRLARGGGRWCLRRDRCTSKSLTSRRRPTATPPSSKTRCGKGTYVRSLAVTWGASSAARAPHRAAADAGCQFRGDARVTAEALKSAAESRRGSCSACCCRSRRPCRRYTVIDVGQNDAARLLRGQPC